MKRNQETDEEGEWWKKEGVKGRIEDDSTAQRGRCTNTQTLRVITARRATHRRRGRE